MGTAKIDWDTSWSADSTIGATIDDNDTTSVQSAEYSTDGSMMFEFSVNGTYASGTYDGPALMYVLRKCEATTTYEEKANAYAVYALNGASATSFNKCFTVGPEVNSFILEILNESGLQITSFDLDYKQGHVITA